MIDGWKCYDHAAIPTCAPHEDVNTDALKDKNFWKKINAKGLYLARWTSDWDCGDETNWWYVIKDTPFDISMLKSKRRYEINKGNRNFDVREINPSEYASQLFEVAVAAYETYPAFYRPNISYNSFIEGTNNWRYYKTYAAFSKEDGKLCAYACLFKEGKYIDFRNLKACPDRECLGVNAAVIYRLLTDHEAFLLSGGYICDGARSIQHETAFQEYLEKYFGFRKAYCKLHVEYRPLLRLFVAITYPCRGLLRRLSGNNMIRRINALLKLEEIRRNDKGYNKYG